MTKILINKEGSLHLARTKLTVPL